MVPRSSSRNTSKSDMIGRIDQGVGMSWALQEPDDGADRGAQAQADRAEDRGFQQRVAPTRAIAARTRVGPFALIAPAPVHGDGDGADRYAAPHALVHRGPDGGRPPKRTQQHND